MSRQKLLINLAVVVVCGIIAVSIPVIVNHISKPVHAESTTVLVSTLKNNNFIDTPALWQIELQRGNHVIETWDTIYQQITQHKISINYDEQNLTLTPYGFAYRNNKTTENYHSVVVYQNYSCELRLA